MSTRRFAFTQANVAALKAPDVEREYIYDTRQPGLAICVSRTGRKTWYVYKRIGARPERIRLGQFPELNVETARRAAADALGDIARGLNPMDQVRESRRDKTLQELLDRYIERTRDKKKASTANEYARQVKTYLSTFSAYRVSAVTRGQIIDLHAKIGKDHGKYQANRVLALLSAAFTWGRESQVIVRQDNPASGVERFSEKTRERFLTSDELQRLFAAMDKLEDPNWKDFFTVLLLTGARRSNVEAMAWADVDLDRAHWAIAGEHTKNGDPMVVVLVEKVLEILHRRQKDQGDRSPYVFASWGKSGHLTEPKGAWSTLCESASLQGLRIHDLRRTLGSWQAMAGASLPIIGRSLGHKSLQATQVYARLNLDPVRVSVNAATQAMLAAAAAAPRATEQKTDTGADESKIAGPEASQEAS